MITKDSKPAFAGFWRRLAAFLLDALILGIVGLAVGTPLFDTLAALEGPTRLIGLAVGVAYFGFLSAGAGGSRTLGMRMLGIRVVSMNGRPLGLVRSLWRALILQLPFTLNGMTLPLEDPVQVKIYTVVAATLVFGVQLAQVVLLLFNRPSRRLVHDLLSGAAVVRAGTESVPRSASKAPAVAFTLILLVFGAALALTVKPSLFPLQGWVRATAPLTETQKAVLTLPEVIDVGVNDNTTTFASTSGPPTTTRTLIVTARLRERPKDQDKEIARVGEAALKVYKLAPGQTLRVVLTYGYDIGIASGWRSWWGPYPPAPAAATAAEPAKQQAQPESAPNAKPASKPDDKA